MVFDMTGFSMANMVSCKLMHLESLLISTGLFSSQVHDQMF